MRLDLAIQDVAAIAAQLFSEHPELAEDDILRADMLEGCTSIDDVFRAIATRIREAQADAEANANLAKVYRERKERFEHREEVLRALAMRLLNVSDLAKWTTPEGTFSLLAGKPKVEVVEEGAIPLVLCKQSITPDKAKIKAALDSGEDVPGARMTNGSPSLRFA
jgi:hypothetical protein